MGTGEFKQEKKRVLDHQDEMRRISPDFYTSHFVFKLPSFVSLIKVAELQHAFEVSVFRLVALNTYMTRTS